MTSPPHRLTLSSNCPSPPPPPPPLPLPLKSSCPLHSGQKSELAVELQQSESEPHELLPPVSPEHVVPRPESDTDLLSLVPYQGQVLGSHVPTRPRLCGSLDEAPKPSCRLAEWDLDLGSLLVSTPLQDPSIYHVPTEMGIASEKNFDSSSVLVLAKKV